MRALVQWIKRRPAPRAADSSFDRAELGLTQRERFEQISQLGAQRLRLARLPIVKLGRVLDREPGQKIVAIEIGRAVQCGEIECAAVAKALRV